MKNVKKTTLSAGKWLSLDVIDYIDNAGTPRKWETVSRKQCEGAVLMIAKTVPEGDFILVRQYRPPVENVILEFPAGLIDPGEDPSCAAVRELREETGYIGRVVSIFPPSYNSPGLTGEFIRTVLMEVRSSEQPSKLETAFDDSEDIECVRVPGSSFRSFVEKTVSEGGFVDAKVLAFALGMRS